MTGLVRLRYHPPPTQSGAVSEVAVKMKKLLIPIVLLLPVLVTGCAIYKIDVQQGNIITQEALNKVKPDMTREQIRYLLGTPLIQDPFHQQRWDYVYSFDPGGGEREQKRVSLFFQDDRLVRIEGDMRPNPQAAPGPEPETTVVDVEKAHRDRKGLFDRLFESVGVGDD